VDILIIATRDIRNRYKFVLEPIKLLKYCNVTLFKNQGSLVKFIFKSIKFALKNQKHFDYIIHVGGGFDGFFWSILAKIIIKSPFLLRIGGNPNPFEKNEILHLLRSWRFSKFIARMIRYYCFKMTINFVNCIIVVNNSLAKQLYQHSNLKKIKIVVIPQPVLEDICHRNISGEVYAERIQLLTVTNLSYKSKFDGVKRIIDYLIKFVSENDLNIKVNFDILGGGLYSKDLRKYINSVYYRYRYGYKLSIAFHGFKSELQEFYKRADIFLYCSNLDALPNVLLEAKAFGLPILINRYEPFYDVLQEGTNALYFDDYIDFAKKFKILIYNNELRNKIIENNIQNIRDNYSVSAIAQKYEKLFKHP